MFVLLTNVMRAKVHKILQTETFFWGDMQKKSPAESAQTFDDEITASSLLDCLLYKCVVINLKGNSYGVGDRQTVPDKKTDKTNKNKLVVWLYEKLVIP